MGSQDDDGLDKVLKDVIVNFTDAVPEVAWNLADAYSGKNLLSRVVGELTTILSDGKILFPEI